MPIHAFFAYPAAHREIPNAITGAIRRLSDRRDLAIRTWEENDISGRPLTDPIFENIEASDILIGDITAINFNVTFEIGYAIGRGKRVFLFRNSNFRRDVEISDKIGIFDTLGFHEYSDEVKLADLLRGISTTNSVPISNKLNRKTPIYIVQPPTSNQPLVTILARIKKTRLGFTSFIPAEEVRLAANKAIGDVSAALGVVVPLIPNEFSDALIHNTRCAFVAGLAFALEKVVLILQPADGPAPLDVRDFVKTFRRAEDIADHIGEFAPQVTERLQAEGTSLKPKGNFLAELSIGDSVAENEFQTLSGYYLRTDQFGRVARGEANLVVGRKGAGKTALFSQLRDDKRSDVRNIIVDLKPEGYQLIRLKEDVLEYLAQGARTHLITAFFEYVLLLELAYKLIEKDKDRHIRDQRLFAPYRRILEIYRGKEIAEGDFSERLMALSQSLVSEFRVKYGRAQDQRLSSEQVTEIVYKHNIRELRDSISQYLRFKSSVWVLFDNLDKGWSTHGISESDILILRCLIDAARKIQRTFRSDGHNFQCIVFVRNDVYQRLVGSSSDYGKESRVALDWTDPDLLREMIRRRIVLNDLDNGVDFYTAWAMVCTSHYKGEETSQYLIDRSLMRPRNLLRIFSHCRGFAVNLAHSKNPSEKFRFRINTLLTFST